MRRSYYSSQSSFSICGSSELQPPILHGRRARSAADPAQPTTPAITSAVSNEAEGVSIYRTLFLNRDVQGDWTTRAVEVEDWMNVPMAEFE